MPKSQRATPADLTPSWTDAPSSDVAGEVARQLALRVRRAIRGQSVRGIADIAGLDEGTLRNIRSGARWPDLRTIALREHALGEPLWPARERRDEPSADA